MQGPTLEDLKVQAGIDLDDFAFVFAFGALSFPLGNFAAGYLVRHSPMIFTSDKLPTNYRLFAG